MRKYDDVQKAVWLAAAIMSYNKYFKCKEAGAISADSFYFEQ